MPPFSQAAFKGKVEEMIMIKKRIFILGSALALGWGLVFPGFASNADWLAYAKPDQVDSLGASQKRITFNFLHKGKSLVAVSSCRTKNDVKCVKKILVANIPGKFHWNNMNIVYCPKILFSWPVYAVNPHIVTEATVKAAANKAKLVPVSAA
jgi:hypothetical protein